MFLLGAGELQTVIHVENVCQSDVLTGKTDRQRRAVDITNKNKVQGDVGGPSR